jgi:hypothetical protein
MIVPKPIITLIPDAELKRVAVSTHPKDLMIRDQIPPEILEFVLRGENIPLNPRSVAHICRKSVPHDIRGTSIIQRVWKDLMLRDAFREVLFVMAQNHITPLKIYKVGSRDREYFPTDDELMYWQGVIEEVQNDPNFSLVTHDAFDVQYIGSSGQIVDVTRYLEIIESNVLTGLFLSKTFTTSEGPTYSNAVVAYEILQKRYVYFRSIIERWLINKVFFPISIVNGFKNEKGEYIVPSIKWTRIDFTKNDTWRNLLMQMNQAQKKLVSDRTFVTEMGLTYDEEQDLIAEERQAEYVKKKQMKAWKDGAGGTEIPGLGGLSGGIPGGEALPPDMAMGGIPLPDSTSQSATDTISGTDFATPEI